MGLCHRKTCKARIECYTLAESVPVDSVKDGTVVLYTAGGANEVEEAADGAAPIAGVVYAPGCEGFFNAGDVVDVQKEGQALVTAGAAIAEGDTLIADGAGGVVAGAGFIIGVALCDAVAGQQVTIDLNLISV